MGIIQHPRGAMFRYMRGLIASIDLGKVELSQIGDDLLDPPLKLTPRLQRHWVHGGKALELLAHTDPEAAARADLATGGVPVSADFDVVLPVTANYSFEDMYDGDKALWKKWDDLYEKYDESTGYSTGYVDPGNNRRQRIERHALEKPVYDYLYDAVRAYLVANPPLTAVTTDVNEVRMVPWTEEIFHAFYPQRDFSTVFITGPLLLHRQHYDPTDADTPNNNIFLTVLFETVNTGTAAGRDGGKRCLFKDHVMEVVNRDYYEIPKELINSADTSGDVYIPGPREMLEEQLRSLLARFAQRTVKTMDSQNRDLITNKHHSGKCMVDLQRVRWLVAFLEARGEAPVLRFRMGDAFIDRDVRVQPATYQDASGRTQPCKSRDLKSLFFGNFPFENLMPLLNELSINGTRLVDVCGAEVREEAKEARGAKEARARRAAGEDSLAIEYEVAGKQVSKEELDELAAQGGPSSSSSSPPSSSSSSSSSSWRDWLPSW